MDDAKGPPPNFFDDPPTPTPPSIEKAVVDHLDLFGAVDKVQRSVNLLTVGLDKLADGRTVDRLTLERMDLRLMRVEDSVKEISKRMDAMQPMLVKILEGLGRLRGPA